MAIDMNMDVGELFKNLFSKKGAKGANTGIADSPYAKIIIASIVVLLVIILYVVYVYLPMQEKLQKQQEQISQISNLKNDIAILSTRITKADIKFKDAQKNYNLKTKLFHTEKELEDLYRHISMLALSNQLMVLKIESMGKKPIYEVQKEPSKKAKDKNKEVSKKVAYYEFKLAFEISGNYANYTNFRKGMAELKKIINIEEEKVVVLETENKQGEVKVSAILATYRMPTEDEENINSEG